MGMTNSCDIGRILPVIDDLEVFDRQENWYFISIYSLPLGRRNDSKSGACSRTLSEDGSCAKKGNGAGGSGCAQNSIHDDDRRHYATAPQILSIVIYFYPNEANFGVIF